MQSMMFFSINHDECLLCVYVLTVCWIMNATNKLIEYFYKHNTWKKNKVKTHFPDKCGAHGSSLSHSSNSVCLCVQGGAMHLHVCYNYLAKNSFIRIECALFHIITKDQSIESECGVQHCCIWKEYVLNLYSSPINAWQTFII